MLKCCVFFLANSDVCWDVPCRLPRAAIIATLTLHFFNELILQLQLFLNFNSNLSPDFLNLLDFRKTICMRTLQKNLDVLIATSNLSLNHILDSKCSNLANAPNSLLSLKHFSDCNFHMAADRRGRWDRWWSHLRFLAENPPSPLCSSINLI